MFLPGDRVTFRTILGELAGTVEVLHGEVAGLMVARRKNTKLKDPRATGATGDRVVLGDRCGPSLRRP